MSNFSDFLKQKSHYELQVWNKQKRRYEVIWWGQNLVRAQIIAAKPYSNADWQGKKRIIQRTETIILEIPHVKQRRK